MVQLTTGCYMVILVTLQLDRDLGRSKTVVSSLRSQPLTLEL